MQAARENTQYLPGCHFPIKLHAGADLAAAVRDADDLLIATPPHVLRTTLEQLKPLLREGQGLIAACKGLEPKSGKLVHEVIEDVCGTQHPLCFLPGPTRAEEMGMGLPTAVASESADDKY